METVICSLLGLLIGTALGVKISAEYIAKWHCNAFSRAMEENTTSHTVTLSKSDRGKLEKMIDKVFDEK